LIYSSISALIPLFLKFRKNSKYFILCFSITSLAKSKCSYFKAKYAFAKGSESTNSSSISGVLVWYIFFANSICSFGVKVAFCIRSPRSLSFM